MSSRLNLNDNVSNAFGFTLGGLDYDLKYPTMEELEPITEINKRKAEATTNEEIAACDKELEEAFYRLIIPVGHNTPVMEILKKQPLPVVKAFNKMVEAQLAAE